MNLFLEDEFEEPWAENNILSNLSLISYPNPWVKLPPSIFWSPLPLYPWLLLAELISFELKTLYSIWW
jgi:hypothetical protein